MEIRDEILDIVQKLLIGPYPLPGFTQENGEEILYFSSPLKTYVSGILFPQMKITSEIDTDDNEEITDDEEADTAVPDDSADKAEKEVLIKTNNIAEPVIEAETSKINNYKQSAMGITVCVPDNADSVIVKAEVGSYSVKNALIPKQVRDEDCNPKVIISDRKQKCYFRTQQNPEITIAASELPTKDNRFLKYRLYDDSGKAIDGLEIVVTYRMHCKNDAGPDSTIYTFTMMNTKTYSLKNDDAEDCWFQSSFSLFSNVPFAHLPDSFCENIDDSDYYLNAMLYDDVKTFSIGHGCAAVWDDKSSPCKITACFMPSYDVKPINPTAAEAKLSMKMYSEDYDETIADLELLASSYDKWIQALAEKKKEIADKHNETAEKQISLCENCLLRIRNGIELLKRDKNVLRAFQLANKAMLMQQLHYNLPLTEVVDYDYDDLEFVLKNDITLPDVEDENTWYDKEHKVYGKWRPFQIAFILMNLESISNKESPERQIVDLIWFPTGGGKTEAYLGLTAFTVFYRRIINPEDSGTTVIMRYTLRLLTAQQYERASALICSMEKIRSENPKELGKSRITIGLWVGELTANNEESAIKSVKKIQKEGKDDNGHKNVSVMLKCPWCGASLKTLKTDSGFETPGYEISDDKKHVVFRCPNEDCDFGDYDYPLPLVLFDDAVYANPPTLLFGTVDKFAMLPFRPESKSIFGGDNERTPPELIIQDELHLITGPLGSSVGLYETLINELCKSNGIKPKVVVSTATISHAKQQCNALYDCGEDNVFQFPVQGLSYRDCFFAREDSDANGRKYVGLYGSAAPSSASASIFTFAAFIYAAMEVANKHSEYGEECDVDPYWTNLSYFGSIRELGQAATWFIADIKERLEVIYANRLQNLNSKDKRRYIYENNLAELTSRMSSDEIPEILKRLEVKVSDEGRSPLDMCLATNMVSVGVDVQRLGLMTVTGQPKSMSEYIQATSRVGRNQKAPGLVFVIYNTSKPRDKSHYEKFQSQHSKLYFSVEPTSVTPFSRPLRERALPAVFAGLFRMFVEKENRSNASRVPSEEEFERIVKIITDRAARIEPEEVEDIKKQLRKKWMEWCAWRPEKYCDLSPVKPETAPLMCAAGTLRPTSWENRGWDTPLSMRSVDRECGLDCSKLLGCMEED